MRVIKDIFRWLWFSEFHGYNFKGHFIRHADGNLCIDPVEPSAEVLDEIADLGVARILLPNRNHSRAANAVRARTGAKTAIHPEDAAHARGQGRAQGARRELFNIGHESLPGVGYEAPAGLGGHHRRGRVSAPSPAATCASPPGPLGRSEPPSSTLGGPVRPSASPVTSCIRSAAPVGPGPREFGRMVCLCRRSALRTVIST